MAFHWFTVNIYISAGRANIQRWTFTIPKSTQELGFYGDGEILFQAHAFCTLAMQHGTAVPEGPFGSTGALISIKTVLKPQLVIREFLIVKKMPVFTPETVELR